MRTKTLLLTAALSAAGIATSMAQVYSANAVGYVNQVIPPGFSMIANPFVTPSDAMSTLAPSLPDGTSIQLFTTGVGFKTYTLDISLGGWDPSEPDLSLGGGAFINNTSGSAFTITYVGEVAQGSLSTAIPPGFSIRSSKVPQAGPITGLLNYTPDDGDAVQQFTNGVGFKTYTFDASLGGWDPSEPSLSVAESVFIFNIAGLKNWTRTFSVN